jgi:predicted double-glycine peptidase
MKLFHLIKKTRQTTEYSCGASALQAVMSYWGKDVDEEDLMRLLGTTPEEGTYPEDILRVARSQGFEAELKANLTLNEVERATGQGEPVIVLGQMWRSNKPGDASMTEEWDSGHWFIVLAVDKDFVYFEDPYVHMGKGFVPPAIFEDAWHNVMGGDLSKPKLTRMGIFIRGDRHAAAPRVREVDFSGLESGRIGSLNLIVTRFEGNVLPFDFVEDLNDILSTGMIRPDAFIFLRKDREGRVTAVEGGRVEEDDEVMGINAALGALAGLAAGGTESALAAARSSARVASENDFGLSDEELHRIADKLPADHSAIIVLFENLWERKFREVVAKYAGTVLSQRLIGSEQLARLGQELRKGTSMHR